MYREIYISNNIEMCLTAQYILTQVAYCCLSSEVGVTGVTHIGFKVGRGGDFQT
jgi:hypothetical protein